MSAAEVKFVEFLPGPQPSRRYGRSDLATLASALEACPGQWAEIERSDERNTVAMRGHYIGRRSAYKDRIQCAVRKIDGEFVLFARAVPR